MNNSSGFAAIDDMIAKMRGFPRAIEAAAPKLAEDVKAKLAEDVRAQRAPDGTPWKPKKTGGAALVNAAGKITSSAVGTVLLFKLSGPEVFHNFGTSRVPKRQIFPASGLGSLRQAIQRGIVEVFKKQVTA